MKINEAVSLAMMEHERAFKGVTEIQATRIVKLTLDEIAKEVDRTDDGKVLVPGFGTFLIKQVEREKDGEKAVRKLVMVRLRARKPEDSDQSAEPADSDEI